MGGPSIVRNSFAPLLLDRLAVTPQRSGTSACRRSPPPCDTALVLAVITGALAPEKAI